MGAVLGGSPKTTVKQVVTVSSLTTFYLLLSWLVVGFKFDQVFLMCLANLLYYVSVVTRKFVTGFAIFIVYWMVFDYQKAIPNYHFHPVHIADLYNFEKKLFGINSNGKLLTPSEYCNANSNSFFDIIGGIFYLCWIPVPLGFAAYLFFINRKQFLYFSLTFVVVNFLGYIVYYSYPAAPPWYVQLHGFDFQPATHSSAAGLLRFDAYFHVGIFKSIYLKGSNVFAAMPSLHSSYPVIVLYYGLKNRLGPINILLAIVMVGIWLTAVYSGHHYVVDVIAGIICGACGIMVFNILIKKIPAFNRFVEQYNTAIQ
ncbi:MAG TPA: phosphatase PAP2 family protein [Mucilaginibacter sp.]|jgi:membrane-associated phospholipid phosphatase|nr:phosphatase PAP2 family protein [Mucilaginibacter sp.]